MHLPPLCPPSEDGPSNRPPPIDRHRLWLIAGTGEGPLLAGLLLQRGWRLRVSVVTPEAARAYFPHPDLELQVGALGQTSGEAPALAIGEQLSEARRSGDPFRWLVDASHPFALQITAALAEAAAGHDQPLLRLQRGSPCSERAILIQDLAELGDHCRPGARLLLAIGARRMAEAIAATPMALHHARVLPSPGALRQAQAAGVLPERLACLRPVAGSLSVEMALCRRWGIETILCRQAGGISEQCWHRISEVLGLRLLLLRRPPEPPGICALPLPLLLERIGTAAPRSSPQSMAPPWLTHQG